MDQLNRVKEWLFTTPYEGVVLSRRDNFKWITGGNENAVVTNTEVGVAFLLIKKDGTTEMFADSSDCARMEEEQNPLHAACTLIPWYENLDRFMAEYCHAKQFASDTGISGTANVQNDMVNLRMMLTKNEVDRYREVGQECAKIVEQTAMEARPGQTEREVAVKLKLRCIENGINPDCVLVGSDERILNYRHPVPSDKKIQNSLMIVLGGEKWGLNISMTRMVSFGRISALMQERMQKTQYIFACMQNMMQDGLSYKEYFEGVKKRYEEAGYPEEWKKHHQGGPTGYGCREFVASPSVEGMIREGQVYAWNPTIQGTKCEETTYFKDGKAEILTRTKNWPCTRIHTEFGEFEAADIQQLIL